MSVDAQKAYIREIRDQSEAVLDARLDELVLAAQIEERERIARVLERRAQTGEMSVDAGVFAQLLHAKRI